MADQIEKSQHDSSMSLASAIIPTLEIALAKKSYLVVVHNAAKNRQPGMK